MGVFISRVPILRRTLLNVASILQTIPSLAFLALLVPIIGIGTNSAVIVLVAYALLPIIQNTYVGILEVPKAGIESALSLGFSRWQVLKAVEIPLAMPTILAGVRTATAMIIGITTIASLIGAGGLGDFITQGLALNDTPLILLGAIPATLLALLADYTTSHINDVLFDYTQPESKSKWAPRLIIGFFSLFILYLLGKNTPWFWDNTNRIKSITVASKNFTEQLIISEIIAQHLENEIPLTIIRKKNLGDTLFIHESLMKGEIDLYVEYSGSGYLNILNKKSFQIPRKKLYEQLKREYKQKYNLIWLSPLGYENSNVLVVKKDFAKKYNIKSISDLIPYQNRLRIAAPQNS